MIRRFKTWLWHTFLPVWAKESILRENQKLEEQNQALRDELSHLRAYVDGLDDGIKAYRRIIINNGVVRK